MVAAVAVVVAIVVERKGAESKAGDSRCGDQTSLVMASRTESSRPLTKNSVRCTCGHACMSLRMPMGVVGVGGGGLPFP